MKKFRIEEAQAMIPLVDALLVSARTLFDKTMRLEQKAADLRVRIFHSGGLSVNVGDAFRDGEELKSSKAELADVLGEIETLGVQVKDIAAGIVDFPTVVGGQTLMLCWKQGEAVISHWHTADEDFSSRKKLDERFGKGGETRERTGWSERLN